MSGAEEMPQKRSRGRPRQAVEIKRAPLNLKTDPELRASIEKCARANGISITQAVERLVRIGLEGDRT